MGVMPRSTQDSDGEAGDDPWVRLAARLHAAGRVRARIAGRYELGEPIGRGGMGAVYRAHDRELDRPVAVKLLHLPPGADQLTRRRRLRHEALALAQLAHPNVVSVFDVREHEGQLVLVLEYVEGDDLRVALAAGAGTSWQRIVAWFVDAADGLAAAHAAGILHGDVKPANLLLGRDGRVRLADFGLAQPWRTPEAASITDDALQTGSGTSPVAGTPRYMAPEQRVGGRIGPWSDQFSLCLSLAEALTGRHPYDDVDPGRAQASRAAVPRSVWRVVERGLAADVNARWPDMRALADALRRAASPPRAGPVLALVVLGASSLWWGLDVGAPLPCEATVSPPPWRTTARDRVRDAVLDAGAEASDWARSERMLDAAAARWTAVRQERCAGAPPRPEAQREALGCVERLGHAIDARVELLRDADARSLSGAMQAVATITDDCDRAPNGATALAPSRALARVDAMLDAGRYAEALALAREHVDATTDEHDADVLRLRVAKALDALARSNEAIELLESTAHRAQARGDGRPFTDAALALVFLLGQQRGDPLNARVWLRHARAALARDPGGATERAALDAAEATVLGAEGELREARAARERVVAAYEDGHGRNHLTVATALHNLALVVFELGDYSEARRLYERTLAIREAALGPMHPLVGTSLSNLGPVLQRLGDVDAAVVVQRRALEIAEHSLGPEHPHVAAALVNTAIALARLGNIVEAAELERRALRILEARGGGDGNMLALVLSNLANRERALGEPAAAEQRLRRALVLLESRGAAFGPTAAAVHGNLGELLLEQGDPTRAAVELERAALGFEAALGRSHRDALQARAIQAMALAAAGRHVEAAEVAAGALPDVQDDSDAETVATLRAHATLTQDGRHGAP
jgi:tetratricopeptide (TPR) repeat protein